MTGWDGFAKYIGIQGILALMMTACIIYLASNQLPIPDLLTALAGAAWGFYFAKNGYGITNKGIVHYTKGDM